MRRMNLAIVLTLAALVTLTSDTRADESEARRKQVESSLKAAIMPSDVAGYDINDRMNPNGPGISVALIKDFKIDWAKAYGLADAKTGRKLTTETLFNVGSVSKTVCALTAMRLVEMGKLSLDDPINNYLKSWKVPDNEFTTDNPVTLRLLLSHSAGTNLHGVPGYAPDGTLPSIIEVLDGEGPSNTPPIRVTRPPGQGYRYSGGGTTIVQLAVMDVTGKSFEDATRELVLQPLGMNRSTYTQPVDGIDIGERATGHTNDEFIGTEVFTAMGAAGLWSTPSELAMFMIAMMKAYRGGEGAIISQESAREMLTLVNDRVGIGFFLEDFDGVISFGHGGSNTGFHANVWALPTVGEGIITIVNSDAGDPLQTEVARAASEVYGWPEGAYETKIVESKQIDRKTANAITGRYQLGPDDVITIATNGSDVTYRECYWRSRVIELLPLANGNFQLTTGDHAFRNYSEFVFETDDKGNVRAMRLLDTEFVMPRLDKNTIRPLEHIEAEDVEPAFALWDKQSDLSPELMRFTTGMFWMGVEEQQENGIKVRKYVAKRFPLDEEAQEILADAYVMIGDNANAQAVRDKYASRAEALEGVTRLLEAGETKSALDAFDALAAQIGSSDAYRRLFEIVDRLNEEPDQQRIVAQHVYDKLPGSAIAQASLARVLWAGGETAAAIDMMDDAIATSPVADETVIKRKWVRDRWKGESTTLSADELSQYVGDYGTRHIVLVQGRLSYYRDSNTPSELIPVGNHQFMLRGIDYFKMEFVIDANGQPEKIVGHYSSGHTDESLRDQKIN